MLQLCRSFLLVTTIAIALPLTAADSITTDQQAQEATTVALADLKAGDNDPGKTVAAALEFTQLLDYYKEKGNTDLVCEMQANVYWCKKRMNLESLRTYVAAKGASAQALATRAEEIVSVEVPKDQAEAYFERAEKFSKDHATAQLAIVIRYFEVADRFAGTPVSLKAQRLSLDAQRAAGSQQDTVGKALKANVTVPGDLPADAAKILQELNAAISTLTAKASASLAKEEETVVTSLAREAEAAQKRGDLDGMMACQKQMADLSAKIDTIPRATQTALAAYTKVKDKVVSKAQTDIVTEKSKALKRLEIIQATETKKGNTEGALAIKSRIEQEKKIMLMGASKGKVALPENLDNLIKNADQGTIGGGAPSNTDCNFKDDEYLIGFDLGATAECVMFIAPITSLAGKETIWPGKGVGQKELSLRGPPGSVVVGIIGTASANHVGGLQLIFKDNRDQYSLSRWFGVPAAPNQKKQILWNGGEAIKNIRIGAGNCVDSLKL
jgi:hypothetical protein